jgi:hypothetical protein
MTPGQVKLAHLHFLCERDVVVYEGSVPRRRTKRLFGDSRRQVFFGLAKREFGLLTSLRWSYRRQ